MTLKKKLFEKVEAQVVEASENFIKGKIVKKIQRVSEISIFAILGFFLASFGLAMIIGRYFPILDGGFNFLVLGGIFLIISFILSR